MVPRSSHISGNYRTAETCHYAQKESYHIALLNLNLGHINRQPVAAGTAPLVACFLYGTHDNGHFIELLGQYQYLTENKEEHNQFWILHACIFRCAFGHNTAGEMIDPTTGIWTSTGDEEPSMLNAVAPASDEVLASTFDHQDVCILAVQGSTEVESCDAFKPTTGSDRLDVRRMGLAECRVAVFHISSYAWRNAYEETCRRWAGFLTQCLIHQVDFVQGDGNLFAQCNFKMYTPTIGHASSSTSSAAFSRKSTCIVLRLIGSHIISVVPPALLQILKHSSRTTPPIRTV